MNIYFDTEFTGLHQHTSLISLGMITDDNKTFYAEFTDYDKKQVDEWIKDNVIDKLLYIPTITYNLRYKTGSNYIRFENANKNMSIANTKIEVKKDLSGWLSQFKDQQIQLISDVSHYDMVLFIDLFGTALDLPSNISPYCHDINQDIAKYLNISDKEAFDINREEFAKYYIELKNEKKHNALWDAKIIKACIDRIQSIKRK